MRGYLSNECLPKTRADDGNTCPQVEMLMSWMVVGFWRPARAYHVLRMRIANEEEPRRRPKTIAGNADGSNWEQRTKAFCSIRDDNARLESVRCDRMRFEWEMK
jgi:hypothetical protein